MPNLSRVAVLIETSKYYGRGLLEGVARFVRTHRSWSIYTDVRSLDDPTPAWLKHVPCDGILLRTRDREVVRSFEDSAVPVVYLGEFYDTNFPFVMTSNEWIAEAAANHLLNRGFRRVGYVGLRGTYWSDARRDALQQIVRDRGCEFHVLESESIDGAPPSWPDHQRQLTGWLKDLPRPIGIVTCYDVPGLRVLDACRELEIAVPEEIAVVGIDNDSVLCDLATPPLSSVAHNLPEIGYRGSLLLDTLMKGHDPPHQPLCVEPSGVVARQSSDVLAIEDRDVAAALHYIRQHACDGINLQDVLRQVPLTSITLKRRFQKALGRTAKEEIMRIQLNRVKQLLSETDFTLAAIADLAGFKHTEYMSAVFKERTGMTPGQFRKQNHIEG